MRLFPILALCFTLVAGFAPVRAAETKVDLALILAVDSSASVNWDEFNLQINGLAEAFEQASLQQAIAAGKTGAIAVTVVEWSGAQEQRISVPWTVIRDSVSAKAFAAALRNAPRYFERSGTSISGAIRFALGLFAQGGVQTERRVIDISGDGRNSAGPVVAPWRDAAVAAGVVINGLPIVNEEADLEAHFLREVIGGEGAFTVAANDYEDYRQAILTKLIREVKGAWLGV
jgi:hypothetical protein